MNGTKGEVAALRGPWGFVRKRRVVIPLIVIGLIALFVVVRIVQHGQSQSGAQGGKGAGRFGQNMPVAVAVANVTKGDIPVRIPALGTITPLQTVTVRTQISGQLQKIAFQEGQLVHQGDFLAQIDSRPYEAAAKQSEGTLRRDQANLLNARQDLKRYEDLIKEDSVAQQQVDTQRALVQQYEGTVEADQAQLDAAKVNLQYTHIVSPVTGRVGLRQVDQGNYVTPGDTNGIVVITQLEPITALFTVPEDNVSAIMKSLHAGGTMQVEAFDRGNSTKLSDGKLLTADNQIDTATGTIKLRALFDNKDGALFPNQFVNIQLLQETLKDQVVMPYAAVHRGAPNGVVTTFVYVVNSQDSTVAVRPVTLGVVDGERVAVTAGLKAGDVVVTEGGDRLRDGAHVLLPGAKLPQFGAGPQPGKAGAQGQGQSGAPGQAGGRHRNPDGSRRNRSRSDQR